MIDWIKKYWEHCKEAHKLNKVLALHYKKGRNARRSFDKMWKEKQKVVKKNYKSGVFVG